MEVLLDRALDKVVAFYEGNGVMVGDKPTLRYLDEYHPVSKSILAQVSGEMRAARDAGRHANRVIAEGEMERFNRKYGISLSPEAFDEQFEISSSRIEAMMGATDEAIREQDYGTDIVVYRSFNDLRQRNCINLEAYAASLLSHETWHLI